MEQCECGTEVCCEDEKAESQKHDSAVWVWSAVAAGMVLGAVGVIWLMQYRHPDKSMDRLLRRCHDRLEDIESSLATLVAPDAVESEA